MNPTKTLLERLDERIHYNCAFNEPDQDTELLMEAANYIRAIERPIDWNETIERIFIRRDV